MLNKILSIVLVGISSNVLAEQVNFGSYSEATGSNAAAFGLRGVAAGSNTVVFGVDGYAGGGTSAVFGLRNNAEANFTVAFGVDNLAGGSGSAVFGLRNKALGNSSAAFGHQTQTNGNSSATFGSRTEANGMYSAAFGIYSATEGFASAAFGNGTRANGDYSVSFGRDSIANGNYSASYGHSTIAQARDQFVAGQYNYQFPDVDPVTADLYDPLFVIGNGVDANATSNAITVFRNGHTVIHGRMTAMQGITTGSDERLKNSIMPLLDSLDKVRQLQGVSYLLDSDAEQKTQVGFIAQEMEQVVPEVVHEGRDGFLSIAYGQLTPLLVESVKTIDSRVEGMDSRVENMDIKFNELKRENSQLKAALCEINSTLILCD